MENNKKKHMGWGVEKIQAGLRLTVCKTVGKMLVVWKTGSMGNYVPDRMMIPGGVLIDIFIFNYAAWIPHNNTGHLIHCSDH